MKGKESGPPFLLTQGPNQSSECAGAQASKPLHAFVSQPQGSGQVIPGELSVWVCSTVLRGRMEQQSFYWTWPQSSAPIPSPGYRTQVTTVATEHSTNVSRGARCVDQALCWGLVLGNRHASDSAPNAARENGSDSANYSSVEGLGIT